MTDHQKKLIQVKEAAEILGLTPQTIRRRARGTAVLTHVRPGLRKILLLEHEVIALRDELIRQKEEKQARRDSWHADLAENKKHTAAWVTELVRTVKQR